MLIVIDQDDTDPLTLEFLEWFLISRPVPGPVPDCGIGKVQEHSWLKEGLVYNNKWIIVIQNYSDEIIWLKKTKHALPMQWRKRISIMCVRARTADSRWWMHQRMLPPPPPPPWFIIFAVCTQIDLGLVNLWTFYLDDACSLVCNWTFKLFHRPHHNSTSRVRRGVQANLRAPGKICIQEARGGLHTTDSCRLYGTMKGVDGYAYIGKTYPSSWLGIRPLNLKFLLPKFTRFTFLGDWTW